MKYAILAPPQKNPRQVLKQIIIIFPVDVFFGVVFFVVAFIMVIFVMVFFVMIIFGQEASRVKMKGVALYVTDSSCVTKNP